MPLLSKPGSRWRGLCSSPVGWVCDCARWVYFDGGASMTMVGYVIYMNLSWRCGGRVVLVELWMENQWGFVCTFFLKGISRCRIGDGEVLCSLVCCGVGFGGLFVLMNGDGSIILFSLCNLLLLGRELYHLIFFSFMRTGRFVGFHEFESPRVFLLGMNDYMSPNCTNS